MKITWLMIPPTLLGFENFLKKNHDFFLKVASFELVAFNMLCCYLKSTKNSLSLIDIITKYNNNQSMLASPA